jgi:N6-adenosine-specific RNA methylase IME4
LKKLLNKTFDVILVNPPWREHNDLLIPSPKHLEQLLAGSQQSDKDREYWTPSEISDIGIKNIAGYPSLLFLWAGAHHETMENARRIMKNWGYKIIDQITWIKTNKNKDRFQMQPNLLTLESQDSLFVTTKEHCLVGAQGTSKSDLWSKFVQSGIDKDVIFSEPLPGNEKPAEFYKIVEHYSTGKKKVEIFGSEKTVREGWVTVGSSE